MNLRFREVSDAARMIQVEVGGDDVSHVGGVVTEPLQLPHGRLALLADRPDQRPEPPPEAIRVGAVPEAESGVDQDELAAGLEQQAMGDEPAGLEQPAATGEQARSPRAHRPAVEVPELDAPEPM